ncbi:MAG: hypothetical protein LBS84_12645 [Clostridiales bacterium]|nr:hypothetical protein [Clostridiales bacterium]
MLTNPESKSERGLYLFRDSFSSSLAPLLAESYHKITLIDLRYMNFTSIPDFISFDRESDVLFLYSSLVLNNPESLMVSGWR